MSSDLGWMLAATLHGYVSAGGSSVDAIPGGLRGYHILAAAAEGWLGNQLELARRLRVDRTVMTHRIDGLEAAGLVERRSDPADRRARQIVVTEKGSRIWAEVHERLCTARQHVLTPLSEEEQEVLLNALRRLAAHAAQEGFEHACEAAAVAFGPEGEGAQASRTADC